MKSYFLYIFIIIISMIGRSHADERHDKQKWLQKELKLSYVQREAIKKVLVKYRDQLNQLQKESEFHKMKLRSHFKASTKGPDYNQKLLALFDQYRDLRTNYRRTRFLMALEIRENLTSEQLKIFHSLNDSENTAIPNR